MGIKCLKYLLPVILLLVFIQSCSDSSGPDNLRYVDPNIGAVAHLLKPTYPTVHLPNQMMRMIPARTDYLDDQISFFPLVVLAHRTDGIMGILPVTGDLNNKKDPVATWDQELEIVKPYYYKTWLENYNITAEFSPGKKTGYFRFTYPEGEVHQLFLTEMNEGRWEMTNGDILTGEESFKGVKVYLYGKFNRTGTLNITEYINRTHTWISWPENSGDRIEFKYAISLISPDQAVANFKEINEKTFDETKENARLEWNSVMNRIEVEGGTESYRRTFYTALYRCYERMINITEDGKYYSNYDGKVHADERKFYVDDWVWDTYLALHPLRFILDPELESDMIASYLRMYEQSGWLPTFPQVYGDSPAMNGFHSSIMILDAWKKGIRDFDGGLAYKAMKNNALNATMLPWRNGPKCELDDFYHTNGYFPALHPGEKESCEMVHPFEKRQAVAVTLGHSYDDWAMAHMAKELELHKDYEFFIERSGWYKNLYRKETGFFMPKDAEDRWIDIDPKFDGGTGGRDYYDENNGWTYLWAVQHDFEGLINLMGGINTFEQRLDQLFREGLGRPKYVLQAKFPDFTGIVGQFSMGNEPGFHIPYLYNFTSSPWKTQKKIRMLLNTWFMDNIFGIPGDEDGGGMSAFVVFSAMGFYPVTPGIPVYTIGSPLFTKITIHLPDGKDFIVSAPGCSETNKYIQKAYLNGIELNAPWFTHEDLVSGGVLKLEMGPYPNKNWGRENNIISYRK
jgi:predicted alpha-1,2-mannosidase